VTAELLWHVQQSLLLSETFVDSLPPHFLWWWRTHDKILNNHLWSRHNSRHCPLTCHWITHICINLFSNYAWSACPSSEALPMCFSQSTTVTKFFVCFHINTMLLEHFHNMALILMTKMFMPYLQYFRLHCQVELCSMSWNTHPNSQYIDVINELTWCCNSSITSANNNFFFIQGCAVAVLGGSLDEE